MKIHILSSIIHLFGALKKHFLEGMAPLRYYTVSKCEVTIEWQDLVTDVVKRHIYPTEKEISKRNQIAFIDIFDTFAFFMRKLQK